MESHNEARTTIYKELTSYDAEVRCEFLKLFEADINAFSDSMASAVLEWRNLDSATDERRGYIAALVHSCPAQRHEQLTPQTLFTIEVFINA